MNEETSASEQIDPRVARYHAAITEMLCGAFKPDEELSLTDFAVKYVKVGAKKADFDLDFFRWLREPMELMTDYRVPMQAQIMAAQLGKGRSAEAAVPYFIVHDPCDLTWFGMTNEKATEYAEERLMPTLLNCQPVQRFRPVNRHKERTSAIVMDHMIAEVLGANKTNTQSRTRQVIFCDEAWSWEPGMLASAISRTSAPNLVGRRKVIITSTAGDEDSDLERYWDTCDQRCWHVRCPKCNEAHPLALSRDHCRRVPKHLPVFSLIWDDNDKTKPGGVWDIEEVKKTVRMLCPSCKHEFTETPETMRHLRESGFYKAMNPLASKEKAGFWVPRMAAGEWAALVEKFLKCIQEMRMGDDSNLREFMLKDLAEKWTIGGNEVADVKASSDYSLADPPESFVWEKEYARFMTVDRQALSPQFWYLVQAWSQNGESRWVQCGHAETKEEIELIAEKHGLVGDKSVQVAVDAGWEADDTWAWCAKNRWYALRGDDVISYRHTRPGKKSVMKYFSQRIIRRVGVGGKERLSVSCVEFMWSNLSIKNFLNRLKSGKGLYYGIAKDVPKQHSDQLDAEYRKLEQKGGKKVPRWVQRGKRLNHILDCAAMNVVCAFMANLIPIAMAEVEEEPEKVEIEQVV
jgi:hypothetical protein